jgi:hypothetical protein
MHHAIVVTPRDTVLYLTFDTRDFAGNTAAELVPSIAYSTAREYGGCKPRFGDASVGVEGAGQ